MVRPSPNHDSRPDAEGPTAHPIPGCGAFPDARPGCGSAWQCAGRRLLTHRRWPLIVALIAIVLTLPAVPSGLVLDDYHAKLCIQGMDSPVRLMDSPLDLFRFFKDPEHLARMIDFGFAPWWTDPTIRAAFWRPLASLTHWADYTLWPDTPALMHLHSILWYAGAVMVVAVLYRRFMGPTVVAGLAALLFAVDDAHGMIVGFLSNRSDLPALASGMLCLIAHDRWRREGWGAGAVIAPLLLLVSLLFKEAGIATCAYIAAYEVFLCDGRWTGRVCRLLPYAAIVIGWRLCWSGLGYGISGMLLYVDPGADPARFAVELVRRAPPLLYGQWCVPPAEVVWALSFHHLAVWLAVVVFLVLLAVPVVRVLRRDRLARFWAAGMFLSVIPASAVVPMDRMLAFTGLGAMALVAQFLVRIRDRMSEPAEAASRRFSARAVAGLLVAVHLVIAPLVLPVRTAWFAGPRWLFDQLRPAEPMEPSIATRDLVIVNPPEAFALMESPLIWAAEGHPMPRHFRILTSSHLRLVRVYRPDTRTLIVRPNAGFLAGLVDPLFRSPDWPLSLGQRIELTGMTVEITALTPDRRPAEAAFRFAVPLEDASLHWLQWRDGRFVRFIPPAVGERVRLPGGKIGWRGFQSVPD